MIRTVPKIILSTTKPGFLYQTEDGANFEDLDEAVEHENKLNQAKADKGPKPVYEQVWTIQEAINKAVAEKRVVRFLWQGDNASLRSGIVDKKGCQIVKPDRESKDVAVVPPGAPPYDFFEVDTSLNLRSE